MIAVPATALSAIAFDPPLPPEKAATVREVRYGQAAKLFVPAAGRPAPPSATLSVPGRFWCYTQLGRGRRAAAVRGSVRRYAQRARGARRALGAGTLGDGAAVGCAPTWSSTRPARMISTWAEDPWARGAYSAASATSPIETETLAAAVGPLAFAGEHTAGAWHGLMEGALRSGARAAQQVLQTSVR